MSLEADHRQFFAAQIWVVTIPSPDGKSSLVYGKTAAGERTAVLFTDEDLARRFIEKGGIADGVPRRIAVAEKFVKWLQAQESSGVHWVEYDPEENKPPLVFPMLQVIYDVRKQNGL